MSLPVVTEGNPWTVYDNALRDTLYKHPTPGFKARLILLLSLNGVCMLLAAAYFICLVVDAKEKGSIRKGLWTFRVATRRTGSYVVTNTKLFCVIFTIIYGAIDFGYLADSWHVFLQGKPQTYSAGWRTWGFIPLFFQGWLITWGSLQAFFLATDHKSTLSPLVANFLFVGLGSALMLGTIAAAIVNNLAGNRVWNQLSYLLTRIKEQETIWTPETNTLPALFELQPAFNKLTQDADYNRITNIVQLSVMALVPVIVIAVNAGSLRLANLIRTQIRFNIEQVQRTGEGSWTMKSLVTVDAERRRSIGVVGQGISNSIVPNASERRGSDEKQQGRGSVGKSHLSRNDMQYLASRRGSEQDRDRLKHIQALQKAERDLVIIACTLMVALTAIAAVLVYVLVLTISNQLATATWPKFEVALFSSQYIYALAMISVYLGLLWNAFSSRRTTSVTDTIYDKTRQNTTLNSHIFVLPAHSNLSVDSVTPPSLPIKDFPFQWPAKESEPVRVEHTAVEVEQLQDEVAVNGSQDRRPSDSMVDAAHAAQRRRPSQDHLSFDLHQ